MTALDMHEDLNRRLEEIREAHARELKTLEDQLLNANLRATMFEDQAKEARADAKHYANIATSLATQIGTIESLVVSIKKIALESSILREDADPPGGGMRALEAAVQEGGGITRSGDGEQDDTAYDGGADEQAREPVEQPVSQPRGKLPEHLEPSRRRRAAA